LTANMNKQIYEEAGEWFVDFRAGDVDAAARARFGTWMRRSPEHLRAYLEVAAIWNEGAQLDAARRYDPAELIASALAENNLVTLPMSSTSDSGSGAAPSRAPWRRRQVLAIAASLLIAVGAIAIFGWAHYFAPESYATGIGEQRSFTLADGSTIELNARSQLTVRLGRNERRIELQEGQALFHVAHDASRPFVVYGETARVQAVGTQFDVKRRGDGAVITVVEGRVTVGSGEAVMLSAGEQVRVADRVSTPPVRVDVAAATAWTRGRLIFEETPLSEVVEEFNRHNRRRLVVGNVGIRSISGAFSSTDPVSFVNFLRQRPGLIVTETADEIRVSRLQ